MVVDMSVIALKHWATNRAKQRPRQDSDTGTASQIWQSVEVLICFGLEKELAVLSLLYLNFRGEM